MSWEVALGLAELVFWTCGGLLAYVYVGYPMLLFLAYVAVQIKRDAVYLRRGGRDRRTPAVMGRCPAVTLIVAAYNEERDLGDHLVGLARLAYPVEKLEIVIVSDGSTDRTNEILRNVADPRVRAIFLPARRGKWNALNRGVSVARHEILMFADASTVLDSEAVTKLVRHFDDPRVGAVCGALEFRRTRESAQTEGVYWRYESALRLMEGRLGATLTASGALYAVRKECYVPLAADAVIDDFVIPMLTRQAGFRVVYDPEAVATEVAAAGISGEFRRRVRLAVGSFRAIGQFARVRLDPITLWAFVSHKVLRWIVPFLLLGLLVSSVLLWQRPLYMWVLVTQGMFYLWAMAGLVFPDRLRNVRFGLIAYYVLAIHVAFLVGFIRYISGRQESTWQRVS